MGKKLTPREVELLALIVNGNTDAEICQTLNMTDKSVDIYKKNLLKHSGAKNLPHLVSWYYTTYFERDVSKDDKESCEELRKKYDQLKEFYEAGKQMFPREVPMVVEKKKRVENESRVGCQQCLVKQAKIRELRDKLHFYTR